MDFDRSKLSEEAADEVEALFAIYEGDISATSEPEGDGPATCILMQFRPRTADDALNSFVLADIIFSLPVSYPAHTPRVQISRTCGLGDEGRALRQIIDQYLADAGPGEPVLMNLFEEVFGYLDSANEGECLICNESLTGRGGSAIRTNCYHCFHIACLCRWGAICHLSKRDAKVGSVESTQSSSRLKSLESDLRSQEETREIMSREIARLEAVIIDTEAKLSDNNNAEVEAASNPGKKSQKWGKAPPPASNSHSSSGGGGGGGTKKPPQPAASTKPTGKKGKSVDVVTRAPPLDAESSHAPIAELEPLTETEIRHINIQLTQYREAVIAAKKKLDKLSAGIIAGTEAVMLERSLAEEVQAVSTSYPHADGVKCPFCTTILSEHTHPHAATSLHCGFDLAITEQLSSARRSSRDRGETAGEGDGKKNPTVAGRRADTKENAEGGVYVDNSIINRNGNTNSCSKTTNKGKHEEPTPQKERGEDTVSSKDGTTGLMSVLSLPPLLLEMVRDIQNKQAQLKSRLRCGAS